MHDPTFQHSATVGHKEAHGQGIEKFVGKHHAVNLFGQMVEPADSCGQLSRDPSQGGALPFAHGARDLEDCIGFRSAPSLRARHQEVGSELPGSGPELENLCGTAFEPLSKLGRECTREERRQRRRRDEVPPARRWANGAARAAGFACPLVIPPLVITDARCIQRERHIVIKAQPAAGLIDRMGNPCQAIRHVSDCRVGPGLNSVALAMTPYFASPNDPLESFRA